MATTEGRTVIDASGVHYRQLNQLLKAAADGGATELELHNVYGQRYIGTNLHRQVRVTIHGVPGSDLGVFMDGPVIEVFDNVQDGVGNTMNSGQIIVHGHAGDVLAMSMRGGEILIQGDVGYRAAIHMKEYLDQKPLLVIGGTAQDFFGEYMAGGVVLLLGLGLAPGELHKANFIGTGMHAGVIYLRGTVAPEQLGAEVGVAEPDESDWERIRDGVERYSQAFGVPADQILAAPFHRLYPKDLRPYGRLYAY